MQVFDWKYIDFRW